MAVLTDVTRTAPSFACAEIEIYAPRRFVWNLHTDVNVWPRWQPDIRFASSGGRWAVRVCWERMAYVSEQWTMASACVGAAAQGQTTGIPRVDVHGHFDRCSRRHDGVDHRPCRFRRRCRLAGSRRAVPHVLAAHAQGNRRTAMTVVQWRFVGRPAGPGARHGPDWGVPRTRSPPAARDHAPCQFPFSKEHTMSTITTSDGTEIYYKDWGEGPAVTLSHGWPLSADAWDGQMLFLAQHGFRCHRTRPARPRPFQPAVGRQRHEHLRRRPRRGHRDARPPRRHGRRPLDRRWRGRALHRAARNGTRREGRADLGRPAGLVKSDANPEGLPVEAFDGFAGRHVQRPVAVLPGPREPVLRRQPARLEGVARSARPVLDLEHAVGPEELVRVRQLTARIRLHRGPRALRRPDAADPRRRRPGRSRRQHDAVGAPRQERQGHLLPGRAARH